MPGREAVGFKSVRHVAMPNSHPSRARSASVKPGTRVSGVSGLVGIRPKGFSVTHDDTKRLQTLPQKERCEVSCHSERSEESRPGRFAALSVTACLLREYDYRHSRKALTGKLRISGRWQAARRPTQQELNTTSVIAIPIDHAAAKVRRGAPGDNAWPLWAGVLPLC